MRALVTGASGFTGGAICQRLVREGWQVTAFVRESSNTTRLKQIGVECIVLDITDRNSVARAFPEVDVVFHIASAYRSELADHRQFWRVNVDATGHILDEAGERGVSRFVHCSTVGVQGGIEEPPASEDYRLNPGDHYQESKLAGERLALDYFTKGLNVSVVRPVGIYGPGDIRFLKLFKPISKGYFAMVGSGESLYHMTYIDDLVDGFMLAAERQEAIGEVFTIAGEHYSSLNDLVKNIAGVLDQRLKVIHVPFWPVMTVSVICDRVCRVLGVAPPIYPRRVEFFHLTRAFSIEKARRLLGYSPKFSLSDGLRQTADWYRSKGLI